MNLPPLPRTVVRRLSSPSHSRNQKPTESSSYDGWYSSAPDKFNELHDDRPCHDFGSTQKLREIGSVVYQKSIGNDMFRSNQKHRILERSRTNYFPGHNDHDSSRNSIRFMLLNFNTRKCPFHEFTIFFARSRYISSHGLSINQPGNKKYVGLGDASGCRQSFRLHILCTLTTGRRMPCGFQTAKNCNKFYSGLLLRMSLFFLLLVLFVIILPPLLPLLPLILPRPPHLQYFQS